MENLIMQAEAAVAHSLEPTEGPLLLEELQLTLRNRGMPLEAMRQPDQLALPIVRIVVGRGWRGTVCTHRCPAREKRCARFVRRLHICREFLGTSAAYDSAALTD
jgi:hypothetical protein